MPKKKKEEKEEKEVKKELTHEEQLKILEQKQTAKRGHYCHYNLYPDNPVMMRFLEWLTGHKYIGNAS